MKEAKQVIINGTQGEGSAEITYRGNAKECKGIASLREARSIKEVFYNGTKEAEYTGIVYDQGKESIQTFTITLRKLVEDSSGNIQVSFEAKGEPYAG